MLRAALQFHRVSQNLPGIHRLTSTGCFEWFLRWQLYHHLEYRLHELLLGPVRRFRSVYQ